MRARSRRKLARRVPSQPILLLLTYRSDEVHAELAAFLAALDRERLSAELLLPRLSIGDVDAQIRAIFGMQRAVSPEFLGAIYAATESNPFFIEETLKALLAAGDITADAATWDMKPFSELRLPRSVQLAALQDYTQALAVAQTTADRSAEWQGLLALGFLARSPTSGSASRTRWRRTRAW